MFTLYAVSYKNEKVKYVINACCAPFEGTFAIANQSASRMHIHIFMHRYVFYIYALYSMMQLLPGTHTY